MISVFRTTRTDEMTDSNSLESALISRPDIITPALIYLFSSGKEQMLFSNLTHGGGNIRYTSTDEYEWNVMGRLDENVECVKVVTGGSTPGIGSSQFILNFKKKWFGLGDVICGPTKTFCRVQEQPRQSTNGGFDYTLQLTVPDASLYLPAKDYTDNARWAVFGSAFEEMSTGGTSRSTKPDKLMNQLLLLRKSHTVSAKAAMSVTVINFDLPDGTNSKYWVNQEVYQHMQQWWEEVELMNMFSEYNRTSTGETKLHGENGRYVPMGAGVRQQISGGNEATYTQLTTRFLDNILADCTFNIKGEDNRKFMIVSGDMGFVEVHNALDSKAREFGYTKISGDKFIYGSGQNLGLQGQFTGYKGLNGVEIYLKRSSMHDNTVKHTLLHPISLRPLQSYELWVLDMSTYENEANMQGVSRKDNGIDRTMQAWSVNGSITPNGGTTGDAGSNNRASAIDGYSTHYLSQTGIYLKNTISCALITNNIIG